jgi:hypothetical protein
VRLAPGEAPQLVGAEEEAAGGLGQQGGVLRAENGRLELVEVEGEVLRLSAFLCGCVVGEGW